MKKTEEMYVAVQPTDAGKYVSGIVYSSAQAVREAYGIGTYKIYKLVELKENNQC